jgi:hypothetical protein
VGSARELGVLLAALLLFIVPGWALLAYWLPDERLTWTVQLGLASGLGLCVYPLILLWTRVIGVQPGMLTMGVPTSLAVAALVWRYRHLVRITSAQARAACVAWLHGDTLLPDIMFVFIALLVLGVRLFVIRGIEIPMWGDSVQHAVISQLVVDHGGLFDSWLPYTPFQTLTVHFGFYSHVAAVHWLMGGAIPSNTLLTGQIVNWLAILALVPLAHRLVQNRWAGVGVMLVAGLLSPMPMEYVNWGRYPQLAGQAILPVAAWLTWKLSEPEGRHTWRVLFLVSIALAGMFLSYYRMPHYYAAFVVAWLLAWGLPRWRLNGHIGRQWVVAMVGAGLAMLAFVVPWLIHIRGGNLAVAVSAAVATGSTFAQVQNEYQQWRDIALYVPWALTVLASIGLIWGVVCHPRHGQRGAIITIAAWAIGLSALTATRLIRLPGSSEMTSFAIMISLYITVGLLGGYLMDSACGSLSGLRRFKPWGNIIAAGGLAILALWGVKQCSSVINPAYRIVAPADLAAMKWIRANTPADARFLADGFLVYNGFSIVGSDAGWWIPLLAGRENTMPPQYALLSEKPIQPDYPKQVTNLVAQLRQVGVTSPQGMRLLCQQGVTHVYVGQGQGRIAIPPPQPMLSISELEASPHFKELYRQDKVGVFAFDTQVCPAPDGG